MTATQIRVGNILKIDNTLFRVLKVQHITPGKGNAQVQADIRNLKTGIKNNVRFRSVETVDRVETDEREMTFLYQEGPLFHFMDPENYEQIELSKTLLEDAIPYLKPDTKIVILSCEGNPISVNLPLKMIFTVKQCDPPTKGIPGNFKEAVVDSEATFKVPLFIREGDKVIINTETGEYLEKG